MWKPMAPPDPSYSPAWGLEAVCTRRAYGKRIEYTRAFRVTTERPKQPAAGQPWRADRSGDVGWEALTHTHFATPADAKRWIEAWMAAHDCRPKGTR